MLSSPQLFQDPPYFPLIQLYAVSLSLFLKNKLTRKYIKTKISKQETQRDRQCHRKTKSETLIQKQSKQNKSPNKAL